MKRSDVFQEIIGQQRVIQILSNAIEKNQVSHSYIFSGPQGTQRRRTAMSFAQVLLTQEDRDSSRVLHRIQQKNHPDLKELFPDGAGIRIHQIRSLIGDISIRPLEGEYKVYIIHDAHTMGEEAQNALLKTLEEPPSYGIVVLLTHQLPKLLPTIRSRSQILAFHPLQDGTVQKILMEKFKIEETKARGIALMSKGRIEKALALSQGEDILQEREEVLQRLLKIVKGDVMTVFSLGKILKDDKEKLEDWLDFMILWYRDVALYKAMGNNPWIVHREHEELLKDFSCYLSEQRIHDIIEEINASKNNRRIHVNPQLNMEAMLLKMQEESHHG